MKQTAVVLLALACFALTAECGPDPRLQKLAEAVFHTTDTIDKLTRQFEIAATSGDKFTLESILTESKKLPANISAVQYDLKEEISRIDNFHEHAFRERLQSEFELLAVNAKARQLKAVQLEALGITSGVSQASNYQFSDSLSLTLNYVGEHFLNSFFKLAEVDQLLEDARKRHLNDTTHVGGTVLDAANKTKVLKSLKDFSTSMVIVRAEVETKYYSEVEAMRLKGEELSLRVRFEIESAIDSVNFAIHYAAEISQMIEKFSTVSPKLMKFLTNF